MEQGVVFKKNKSLLHVCFYGDIDTYTVSELRVSLNVELLQFYKYIIFDFTNVKFMDSSAIGLILGRYNNVRNKSQVYLYQLSDIGKRMFELTGLFDYMPLISDYHIIYDKAGVNYD